jgi:modulator of FtsH protease
MIPTAYDPESWQNLFIMLGGASAALAGLLFVAVSLHFEAVVNDRIQRERAWANTFMIVVLLINSVIILVPQSIAATGIELCLVGALYPPFLVSRAIAIRRSGNIIPRISLVRASISIVIASLGIVGGISLVLERGGGFYILAIQSAAILAWVIVHAWSLLLAVTTERA